MHSHQNEEITARLINWGLWNRGGYPNLGTPAFVDIMSEYFPQAARINPDAIDGEHIEEVISSLDLGNRNGKIGNGTLYAFVLRLEYIEYQRPREAKAEHVRHKYKRKCSERTFRYHLYNAKRAILMLSNPLFLPENRAIVTQCIID